MPIGITRNKLRKVSKVLAKIDKADVKRRKSRRRYADYKYLTATYRAYLDLRDTDLLRTLGVAVTERGISAPSNWHPIRLIIEATATKVDPKIRSRWTRALEYAALGKTTPDNLISLFKENRGIAGTARLATKYLRKRRVTLDCWSDRYEIEADEDDFEDAD